MSNPYASHATSTGRQRRRRLLPRPTRLAPFLRLVPEPRREQLLERAMARVLAQPLSLNRGARLAPAEPAACNGQT